MPNVTLDIQELTRWEDALINHYENEDARTSISVSSLIGCLRRPVLSRIYTPVWNIVTLYRFSFGRALEQAVFQLILPHTTRELEVVEDGITGHIDFADDPADWECKLTWKNIGKNDESSIEWLKDQEMWLEQAGSYAVMRRRVWCRFAVMSVMPIPHLMIFRIEWSKRELGDIWQTMLSRRDYRLKKDEAGELPARTPLTFLCKGCQVEKICYSLKR